MGMYNRVRINCGEGRHGEVGEAGQREQWGKIGTTVIEQQ